MEFKKKKYGIQNHAFGESQSFVWGKILDICIFKCSWVDFKEMEWGEMSPGASDRNTGLGTIDWDHNKTWWVGAS